MRVISPVVSLSQRRVKAIGSVAKARNGTLGTYQAGEMLMFDALALNQYER
ncbi:hypothetical protein MNVI_36220 [Mycobacterium noviomagense]|uniref:Uncharacterized protein n=1 Tax=Mycobacterium noviomagense TaxID=459858 RepID=A0A7I7PI75_9MYCO|nr:hypothetical protein MNVI_36220 [Mycobacterium noviomagense]